MLNIFAPLLDDFAAAQPDFTPHRYGLVTACDGGLIEVSGLAVPVGALCRVSHGSGEPLAEVIGFRNGRTLMMLLGDTVMLRPGARVRPEGSPGMLDVGEAYLGRAVDGEGHAIDGLGPIHTRQEWPAGGIRTSALDRAPVRESFDTGVASLNALTTFGIGQRIGIMAGSGVGKSVLLDMIASGAEAEIVVVGLIGERAREVSDFVARHMTGEKRARTAIVAVPADHAPNLRLRGALLATSLAEQFRAQGRRVLLIMDSLTRVAHAAREIALLLGEPGAARGYPSRSRQRAAMAIGKQMTISPQRAAILALPKPAPKPAPNPAPNPAHIRARSRARRANLRHGRPPLIPAMRGGGSRSPKARPPQTNPRRAAVAGLPDHAIQRI